MTRRFLVTATLLICGSAVLAQLPPVPTGKGPTAAKRPKIVVAQRMVDVGRVLEGDKTAVEWLIENRGNAELIIERTRATCGCTVVELSPEEAFIAPGESLVLRAEFDSTGRPGTQQKAIHVFTNDALEPEVKLEFTASVEALYLMNPRKDPVNLRILRRGETAKQTIEFRPAPGRKSVEILDIVTASGGPIRFAHAPFDADGVTGQRVSMTVPEHVALGAMSTTVTFKLRIDGTDRQRVVAVRGHVAGDLTWLPLVIDNTRHPSRPGKRFAPLSIRATDKRPFDVLGGDAGEWFDVSVTPLKRGPARTQYAVQLTLREGAPVGPFGTTLTVRTSALDQPIIRVPVFGIVAEVVIVDPPLIAFRQDGTAAGTKRRLKLQVQPQLSLEIAGVTCDRREVVATIDREASSRYRHVRFLDVQWTGALPAGTHRAVLTVETNRPGGRRLDIPVVIEVPDR